VARDREKCFSAFYARVQRELGRASASASFHAECEERHDVKRVRRLLSLSLSRIACPFIIFFFFTAPRPILFIRLLARCLLVTSSLRASRFMSLASRSVPEFFSHPFFAAIFFSGEIFPVFAQEVVFSPQFLLVYFDIVLFDANILPSSLPLIN